MKVLVLGYGSAGRRHVGNLLALGAEVGSFDPAAAPLGDPKVRCFATEGLAFEWGPEAVVVATPAASHARLFWHQVCVKAPRAAVYLEKPVALAEGDWWAPSGVERRARLGLSEVGWRRGMEATAAHVSVGYQLRLHPSVREVRELLAERRAAGDYPILATFWVHLDMATWPGGAYADELLECSHEVDLALHLFGPATVRHATRDGHDWHVVLQHTDGVVSSVVVCAGTARYWRGARVHLPGGAVGWDWRGEVPHNGACYADAMRRFLAAAELRAPATPPLCTLAEGLAVLRAVDAAKALIAENPNVSRGAQP